MVSPIRDFRYHDLDENPELIKLKNIVGFCESNAICNRLSYADFLAKPLQRLTKYPLLIRELLKNQPDGKNTFGGWVGFGGRVGAGMGIMMGRPEPVDGPKA